MKRNRKYNKKLVQEKFMNGLRHIVLLLGIGVFSSVLFSQDCDNGMVYMEYLNSDGPICVPTDFSTTHQSVQQAFYFFNSVTMNGVAVESDDWVGAFNGDICVGARKWDTSMCGGGVCDVPVFGSDGWPESSGYMQAGDFPSFKIYDALENSYYDALPSENIPWSVSSQNSIDNLNVYPDCNDDLGGTAWESDCGCVDADNSGDDCDDCAGVPNGDSWESDCGCVDADNSGDDCDDCAGVPNGTSWESDCGCVDADNSGDDCDDCAGVPNGTSWESDCGCVDTDNSGDDCDDCAGVPNGDAELDNCGVCDGDDSTCSGEYDNCGVWDGDDSDCWYIDIEASVFNVPLPYICIGSIGGTQEECEEMGGDWTIDLYVCIDHPEYNNQADCESNGGEWANDVAGSSDEQDLNNRIGMHTAADDSLNTADDPDFQCGESVNCYADVPEPSDGQLTRVEFYFPHPEWENPLGGGINNYTRDIRALEDLSDFQEIRVWDAVFSTNEEADIVLSFNITNPVTLNGEFGYTRLFVLHDKNNDGQPEYTEIIDGDNYTFFHSYDIDDSLKIIVGSPEIVSNSRVTVVSPNGNEIRSIEKDLVVKLEYELFEFIDNLKLDLQIMECSDADYTTNETCELVGGEWSAVDSFTVFDGSPSPDYEYFIDSLIIKDFYNANNIDSHDYLSRFSIHAEIIDKAGGNESLFEDYQDDSDNTFTISKPESTTEFKDGWHLLSPPLGGTHDLVGEDIFPNTAFECAAVGCSSLTTVNSGTGFYVRSYGEDNYEDFTFNGEVLSEFISPLQQGWNLIGNPLVTPIDINLLIIKYNGTEYSWPAAALNGFISPIPIIYDNDRGSHVGTNSIPTAAGFWVESLKQNVEILFDPTNPISEPEPSSYWSLSLFAKENSGGYHDDAIGSEIIIGIHEDAIDGFLNGEDQKTFPLGSLNSIGIDSYTELSIDNGGLSIYRDIRDYKAPIITWDISVNSVSPHTSNGIELTWESPEYDDPYDYYLDISGTEGNVCEEFDDIGPFCIDMKAIDYKILDDSGNIKITASLQAIYIGCTHSSNVNSDDPSDGVDCLDINNESIDCLGGSWATYCNILSLSFGYPGADPDSSITLFSVPDDIIDQSFDLPILLSNGQANEIEGLQFVLEYDADEIVLDSIILDQQLINDYFIIQENCPECSPDAKLSVSIYAESGNIFTGEGAIFSLSGFGLQAVRANISFSSILINESESSFGDGIDIDFGSIYYFLSGVLNYYNGGPVIDGTFYGELQNNPTNNFADNTDIEGLFNIPPQLGNTTYTLEFSKNEKLGYPYNYFDGLSALDASRIARHSVGSLNPPLSPKAQIAANINFDYRCEYDTENGNGPPHYSCLDGQCSDQDYCDFACGGIATTEIVCDQKDSVSWLPNITVDDAKKVAKYAAGIENNLYDSCDPHWIFLNPEDKVMIHNANCDSLPNYNNFTGDYELELLSDTTLTFEGIRLGDVSGNWSAPLGRQNENYFVDNPMVAVEPDEIIKLPIYLPNNVEIEGIDLTIQYDPEVFSLIGYSNRNSILEESTYPTIINKETSGLFKLVSYANSTPIYDNGLLGYIKFKVVSQTTAHSTISMVEMEVNEIPEGGFLIVDGIDSGNISRGFDFQIIAVPDVFALNHNYPNPFNPSTNIQFELPIDGDVEIFIYDLKGSLIDELMNGYMEAGYHQIKWDGSRRASGMYFIRMIADNGNYIKMSKMMLVK